MLKQHRATRQKTVHAKSHGPDPAFDAHLTFEHIPPFETHSSLAPEPYLPMRAHTSLPQEENNTHIHTHTRTHAHTHTRVSKGVTGSESGGRAAGAGAGARARGGSTPRNVQAEGFLLVQVFDTATSFKSAVFLGQVLVPLSSSAAPKYGNVYMNIYVCMYIFI